MELLNHRFNGVRSLILQSELEIKDLTLSARLRLAINVAISMNICREQDQRKMCPIDPLYYVSPVVASLSASSATG